jgi:hypothetical protein
VVEGARLESVYRGNSIEGSNPSLSARLIIYISIICTCVSDAPQPSISLNNSLIFIYLESVLVTHVDGSKCL